MNPSNDFASQHILIIDDEEALAKAVQIKLQKVGFTVNALFSGAEGLSDALKGAYDVLLLDLMMPDVDGWEILQKLHTAKVKTKVIVTSNLSQEEDKKKAKDLGAVSFLVKSDVTLSQIVEEVKSFV